MATILVSKGGGVFYTRQAAKSSPVGEQGETEGLLRRLAARGDFRVIYHGQWRGEHIDGVEVFEPDLNGVTEVMSGGAQRARFEQDHERLKHILRGDTPIALLNVAGYAPTFSHIDNPNRAIVQAAAVRYTAPMLDILQKFRIPRIVINNDPRTYPRDQEMSHGWDYTRPAALLDQCEDEHVGVVGGKKYVKKSVWARCESWGHIELQENTCTYPALCVAHAHLEDGIANGSHDAWHRVLDGELPPAFAVYGRGWVPEDFPNASFMGGVRSNEVQGILAQAACCPVVSHTPGFYTGKPYVCLACGTVPLLFGDGQHSHTYDPRGELVSLGSELRLRRPGDLKSISEWLWQDDAARNEILCGFKRILNPDWSRLDQLLEDLLSGVDWARDPAWRHRYGGYYPVDNQ